MLGFFFCLFVCLFSVILFFPVFNRDGFFLEPRPVAGVRGSEKSRSGRQNATKVLQRFLRGFLLLLLLLLFFMQT